MSSFRDLSHGAASDVGERTVPAALFGCWRRNWIRFGDKGELDASVAVIWLQTASGMGDIRIDPSQLAHETDSSCGITVVDETTSPYPTADWLDGETGFAQQAVTSYPEKGWLDWESATSMRELAPSGAYVEWWEKLPGSDGLVLHAVAAKAETITNLYMAGEHVFLAVHRSADDPVHEFSYGTHRADHDLVDIELSTVPDRVGSAMRLDHEWRIVSQRHIP